VTGAKHLPDQAIRAQAHQMLGDACAQLGRTADALQHLSQALALAVRAGDIASQGEIHHSLGGAWERHGDDRRALMHAHHALVIFQALDDGFRQGRALNGVGWLQTRLGDYAKARANCQAALALLRQDASARGRFGESHTLDSLGYIAYCLREYDQALEYYDQALVICRADGHGLLEADVLDHVAEVHLAQRRPGQARDAWRKARDLYAAQYRPAKARQAQQRLDSLDENVGSPA
jgi:tetratricopeptide (TPR) repeat protein